MIAPPRPWPISRHPAFDVADQAWTVVSCFFNPAGYRRPVANLGAFLDWCYAERIPVWMAELAYHDARPVLPQNHPRVRQYRMGDEGIMFQKEELLNAVAWNLPRSIHHVLFLDADVILAGGRAQVEDAINLLNQGAKLVQPFNVARWDDAAGRPGAPKAGTGWAWKNGKERGSVVDPVPYHPGFGIGMGRDTFQAIGGLYGCPITGSGDAALLQSALAPSLPPAIKGASHYTAPAPADWRARVRSVIGEAVGYVEGELTHLYHGSMRNRGYDARHRLLAQFRPSAHLRTPPHGLPAWTAQARHLQDAMRAYFDGRREDD